jgi:phospholipid/cholesterol/gamma-HCH transport system substrate-binding protein
MPDRSKIRWSQLKVGIVGLTAVLIAAVLIVLLTSKKGLFTHFVLLRTYVDDASGMQEGTAVLLNGLNIGYLDKLRLTNSNDPKRVVEFDMMVNEKYLVDIPKDSVASIAAANLLGGKLLDISKGRSPEHVREGDELRSLQVQDIPQLTAQMANVLQSFQTIVGRVDTMLAGVEEGKGNIGKFLKDEELYGRLNAIATETQKLVTDVRTGGGTLSKLIYDDSLYQQFQSPVKRVDAILADLQAGRGTAGRFMQDPALFDQAMLIATEIKSLVADLNAGKGTAGKLLKDDQLNQRLEELLTKFSGTLDKINAGQGTVGQFLVNQQLYQSLNGATREFQDLAKDIRSNPKKFLRIKLALF